MPDNLDARAQLVNAEIRAAAVGRGLDTEAITEHLDHAKFVTDDGIPDRHKIVGWLDRLTPAGGGTYEPAAPFPNLEQGARSTPRSEPADPLLDALCDAVGMPTNPAHWFLP